MEKRNILKGASVTLIAALMVLSTFAVTADTNEQKIIDTAVFDLLDMIVVYPVENEHKYSDKKGNVLPDAFLMKRGTILQFVLLKTPSWMLWVSSRSDMSWITFRKISMLILFHMEWDCLLLTRKPF